MSHPALSASRRTTDYVRLLVRDARKLELENKALRQRVAALERQQAEPSKEQV